MKPRSLIFDVYGAFVRDFGNWIAIADLVALMSQLRVEEQVVRSSISRFTRAGLLERAIIGGQVGYELTERALNILREGDERIFNRLEPARIEDGWVLAAFSIPEQMRAERHQLRTRLTWLGFGILGGGLRIGPRRALGAARSVVQELGLEAYVELFEAHYRGFNELRELVRRCWDIRAIELAYQGFIERAEPILEEHRGHPAAGTERQFIDYVTVLHEWRKMPYVDPVLPTDLLPAPWPGTKATALFTEFRERMEPSARRHVLEMMHR